MLCLLYEVELCRRKLVKIYHIDKFGEINYSRGVEKRKPHYNLEQVKAVVADPSSRPFTIRASDEGLAMGLSDKQMREVILNLSPRNFLKSMTTYADHRFWQDVYHGLTHDGRVVYVKITIYPDDRPPVIQFKAK